MSRLVRDARMTQAIRTLAESLVADLDAQNYTEEVRRCFEFVRDSIRYLQDTNGVQLVQSPDVILEKRQANCVGMSTLLASLLESIGHKCKFVAIGYTQPGELEHVYVATLVGRDWISCDPTMPVDIGWRPAPPYTNDVVTAYMVENI